MEREPSNMGMGLRLASSFERTHTSAEFIATAGYDFNALPPALAKEVQLLVAMYGDGRLNVVPLESDDADDTTTRIFRVELELFSQFEGINIVVAFTCPRFYLAEETDVKGVALEDKTIVAVVDAKKTFKTNPGFVAVAQELVDGIAKDAAINAMPCMVQIASVLQAELDEMDPNRSLEAEAARHTKKPSEVAEQAPAATADASEDTRGQAPYIPVIQDDQKGEGESANALDMPYDCWGVVAEYMGPMELARIGETHPWLYDIVNDDAIWETLFYSMHPVLQRGLYTVKLPPKDHRTGEFTPGELPSVAAPLSFSEAVDEASRKQHEARMSYDFDDTMKKKSVVFTEPPKFCFSWAASYRHVVLTMKKKALEDEQRANYTTFCDGRTGKVAKGKGWSVVNTTDPIYNLVQAKIDLYQEHIDANIASAYCDLFHASTKPGVKRLAQFHANFAARNYNVALGILINTPFDKIRSKTRKLMDFPLDEAALQQFISDVRLKSFDSDIENETDVTSGVVVRVKHRDFHQAARTRPTKIITNQRWSSKERRWFTGHQVVTLPWEKKTDVVEVNTHVMTRKGIRQTTKEEREAEFNAAVAAVEEEERRKEEEHLHAALADAVDQNGKVDAFGVMRRLRRDEVGKLMSAKEAMRLAKELIGGGGRVKKNDRAPHGGGSA